MSNRSASLIETRILAVADYSIKRAIAVFPLDAAWLSVGVATRMALGESSKRTNTLNAVAALSLCAPIVWC